MEILVNLVNPLPFNNILPIFSHQSSKSNYGCIRCLLLTDLVAIKLPANIYPEIFQACDKARQLLKQSCLVCMAIDPR